MAATTHRPGHEPPAPRWKRLGQLATYRQLASHFDEDSIFDRAAGLTYYALLALVPVLMFLVTLAAFLPIEDLYGKVMGYLRPIAPGDAMGLLDGVLKGILTDKQPRLLTFAAAGAIWVASSGLQALCSALNSVYRVKETRPWWKVRLICIGLTLGLSVLVLCAAAALVTGLPVLGRLLKYLPMGQLLMVLLPLPLILSAVAFLAGVAYTVLPAPPQPWRWVTPGSVLAAVLWAGLSYAFAFYARTLGGYAAAHGSLAAVIVLLTWFYLGAFVLLLGAAINRVCEPRSTPERQHDAEAAAGKVPASVPAPSLKPQLQPA